MTGERFLLVFGGSKEACAEVNKRPPYGEPESALTKRPVFAAAAGERSAVPFSVLSQE